ncbi:PaaI family thioesterase [Arthrobacter sp. UM1]|uniref:PaaI family thioesterase n=1 Tax=Arthrobacter sp. UM1 TaxID=2766776 RepID=UPI001CF6981B|nr:PaaI family thioesterase [Arthrobacter sp. UM1]MCB4207612.1 PaaI family thioesterase [Arthrobacter sp. UM1]
MTSEPSSSQRSSFFPPEAEYAEELTDERRAFLESAGVPPEHHEMLKHWGLGPLGVKMGLRFEEISPERMVATMPVDGNQQVAGILHGGAHVVLAETLGSMAAALHAWPHGYAVGVDINATHHRSARSGLVRGTATAVQLGRRLCSHEVVMTDEDGRRLSTARITNMVIPFER